ncbi:MAG: hypothetical protein NVS2B4_20070 [Ramlibacter sp.]
MPARAAAPPQVRHAFGIAAEHLDVGHHVVAKAHGLRDLHVGEPREDGVDVGLGQREQGALQVRQQPADQVDLAAQPQAHVGGDLVVAAAPGVQALAGIANQLRQARLDVQVHVLQIELPVETASLDVFRDLGHPALDVRQVPCGDDPLRRQHARVG